MNNLFNELGRALSPEPPELRPHILTLQEERQMYQEFKDANIFGLAGVSEVGNTGRWVLDLYAGSDVTYFDETAAIRPEFQFLLSEAGEPEAHFETMVTIDNGTEEEIVYWTPNRKVDLDGREGIVYKVFAGEMKDRDDIQINQEE